MSDCCFPEDVTHEIMLRLPIKSLLRFRAVCKSWRSMIQTSAFILSHTLQSNNQNNTHLLLLNSLAEKVEAAGQLGEVFSLHLDTPEVSLYTKLLNPFIYINTSYFPEKRTSLVQNFHVVGTCNGLICLAANFAAIIWNPCVRKFVILPKPRITFPADSNLIASYAFCYDSRTDDYKVLRIVSNFFSQCPCEVEVWSLARGSWKSLSAAVIPPDFSPSGFTLKCRQAIVNGVLHWLQSYTSKDNCILWFDMVSELFGRIMMPDALKQKYCVMSRYEESLALFDIERCDEASDGSNRCTCIHMWVMQEFPVAESWTKVLSIRLEGTVLGPFCFRRTGEVVFRMYGGVLASVDPKTKQVKEFEIDGYMYHFMDSFVESLVLLGQPNVVSY